MSKRIANEKVAEEAKKMKRDNENIENHKSLDKNEIEELEHRKAIKFIELFHKSFYWFQENRIKKKEVSADADLESTDGAISDIVSKIVARIRSLINLDREVKKENKDGSEHKKTNFLKVIENFFHTFFNSTKKRQWQEQGEAQIHSDDPLKNISTIPAVFQWNSTGVMENYWKMTGTNGTSGIPLKFRWNSSSS